MNEKIFKILAGIFFIIILVSFFWPSERSEKRYDVNVQTMIYGGDGLDLATIGSLLKKAENAGELERLLNDSKTGINNLDLNEDGKVDYIKVTEYGNEQAKGFSLTVEPVAGETQEVATIEIEKSGNDQASVEVKGNEQIYGQNHYHRSSFGMTDMLFMYWLFRPHPFYMSPYGYGHYPGGYRSHGAVSQANYQQRTAGQRDLKSASSSTMKGKATSPNANKSAAKGIKTPLKKPSSSQKSFQKRNPSKQVTKSAFGRSSKSRPSRPSVRRSSGFGRSGGRFGGK
ncbi:MAG: hypothetical protein KAI69_02445 [Deltaproteobacteria bacterium]|nr:hypothetical protein [Deltaproteobacteria bacterium]